VEKLKTQKVKIVKEAETLRKIKQIKKEFTEKKYDTEKPH
jgi:hypothetical protein